MKAASVQFKTVNIHVLLQFNFYYKFWNLDYYVVAGNIYFSIKNTFIFQYYTKALEIRIYVIFIYWKYAINFCKIHRKSKKYKSIICLSITNKTKIVNLFSGIYIVWLLFSIKIKSSKIVLSSVKTIKI